MLFSLMLAMTNFCLAMLLYPTAVKAAAVVPQNHLGCSGEPDPVMAKIKLSAAKTNGTLLPCCIDRNQNADSALFTAEKPQMPTEFTLASDFFQILHNLSRRGYQTDLWPPPEQTFIDSIIIMV
jgi:hypothetical protein